MALRDYFYRFGLALGIGLLIGIQREAVYDEPEGKLFAGARTFSLMSLAGYVMAAVSEELASGLPLFGGALALVVLLALAYHADVKIGKPGMTTEMAAVVAYGTGGLCYLGLIPVAAALGVTVTALLSFKHEFRSLTHAITRDDIYAMVKFAIVAVIVLPILPNQAYGPAPLNVLNPHKIWLMVVFISGMSFVGYVLIKFVGTRRGIGLTGLLGGIASSTAVTMSFSQRSRGSSEELSRPFALALVVAWVVAFVRVLIVVFTLEAALAQRLLIPLGVSALMGVAYSAYLYFSQPSSDSESVEFSNPFQLGPALRFGALYAIILLVARAAQVYFGNLGIYISSFVSGLVDIDAITLSMVDLVQQGGGEGLGLGVATRAVVIAAMANTLFKGVFAMSAGSKGLRRYVWPGLVVMLVTGIAVVLLV
ncbi:MAG: MgtC/SapB family protein [Anaerolineae bacterium]|nr:MgtC/SapB family protein [Anaerolineae bacterium]